MTHSTFFRVLLGVAVLCGWIGDRTSGAGETAGTLGPGREIVTVSTRPGVTLRILLATPARDPKGIFVLFPGATGELIGRDGRIFFETFGRGAALIFAELGFVGAVVDLPSDWNSYGFRDEFRISGEHAEDITKVIEFLRQKWSKPVFLLGHSRGTTSAAHVAAVAKDKRIEGIVLAGSTTNPRLTSLLDVALEKIVYRVMFVHHSEDGCTSLQGAWQQQSRLVQSSGVRFVEVLGGGPWTGNFCRGGGKTAHNFAGKQREVAQVIIDWATGKQVPGQIGP